MPSPNKRRWLLALIGAAVVGAGVLYWFVIRKPEPAPPDPFAPPAYSATRFLNTGSDAHFVGTDLCASCHKTKHASYLLTAHSRALSDVDSQNEPPDAAFVRSGRTFRVYRKDGDLRHEELLADGQEIARVDLPVRYVVGSGDAARTYLVEVDGFLHESPLTYYASKKAWDLSPGYEGPNYHGFERRITTGCLACHAGRVDAGGTVHHTKLLEKAIGCENCHGPGSLHVAARAGGQPVTPDLTIVNPASLSRSLREDICANCHLNGPAKVALRGRAPSDFRPGRPLADYRTDYRFATGNEQMTVVGHVEQLRQSKCYQGSKDLTCVTCHDPHAATKPADPIAFYRQKCLDCHAVQSCHLDETERRKQQPGDNCAACHMKRGSTDVRHVAFTHHRIGIHKAEPPDALPADLRLVAASDIAQLSEFDRNRNLGLAYLDAARKPEYAAHAGTFAFRARGLLEIVRSAGLQEGVTAAALADIYRKSDPALGRTYARQALDAADVSADERANLLIDVANGDLAENHYDAAIGWLQEVTRLRRYSDDWRLLGAAYAGAGRLPDALAAVRLAVTIRPDVAANHTALAHVYEKLGDEPHAKEEREIAKRLAPK